MGREIKRVPKNYDYEEIDNRWHGYVNPYISHIKKCACCSGTGSINAYQALEAAWYGYYEKAFKIAWQITEHHNKEAILSFLEEKQGQGDYRKNLGDAEVQALYRHSLLKFVEHSTGKKLTECPEKEVVNQVIREGEAATSMLYSVIARWIAIDTRLSTLGINETTCSSCEGEGTVFDSDTHREQYNNWNSFDPPEGQCYQVWETVSEGSAVSPVFETEAEVRAWLLGRGFSSEYVEVLLDKGYAPTAFVK